MRMTGYRPYPVPDGSFAGQTILLTDGDDPVSRGLAAAFAALGGDVFVAAEGETAVSAFDRFERPIDILVNCRWQRTLGPAEDLPPRSEGRRVGKECVRPCRSRWSPAH